MNGRQLIDNVRYAAAVKGVAEADAAFLCGRVATLLGIDGDDFQRLVSKSRPAWTTATAGELEVLKGAMYERRSVKEQSPIEFWSDLILSRGGMALAECERAVDPDPPVDISKSWSAMTASERALAVIDKNVSEIRKERGWGEPRAMDWFLQTEKGANLYAVYKDRDARVPVSQYAADTYAADKLVQHATVRKYLGG